LNNCDVPSIARMLDIKQSHIKMLSRVVILPGAPKNSASRLIGQVIRWIRNSMPEIEALATYNNPNLAFSGAIYRATNWEVVGFENKHPDIILDSQYITLRELKRKFGTFDPTKLIEKLGNRIVVQPTPCFPLEIYAYRLRR